MAGFYEPSAMAMDNVGKLKEVLAFASEAVSRSIADPFSPDATSGLSWVLMECEDCARGLYNAGIETKEQILSDEKGETIRGRLIQLRSGADMKAFAENLDMTVAAYAAYETGACAPGKVLFDKLHTVGININWLVLGEGERYQKTTVPEDEKSNNKSGK
jgi:hypothetical protein